MNLNSSFWRICPIKSSIQSQNTIGHHFFTVTLQGVHVLYAYSGCDLFKILLSSLFKSSTVYKGNHTVGVYSVHFVGSVHSVHFVGSVHSECTL